MSGAANRKKGHNLERQVTRDLKLYYPFAKTTRQASRLLDNCGVDIYGVPFLIQCKAGYDRNRPKYEEEKEYVTKNINEHYPKTNAIHTLPFILIHKPNQRGADIQVTMDYELFKQLIEHLNPDLPICQ